jgi:hypothetical protein
MKPGKRTAIDAELRRGDSFAGYAAKERHEGLEEQR